MDLSFWCRNYAWFQCINIFEDAATTCDRLVIFRNDYRCQFIKELKHVSFKNVRRKESIVAIRTERTLPLSF